MQKIATLWQLAASDKSWGTVSNGLTLARLLLSPIIVLGLYHQQYQTAFVLFVLAAATDLLDGYVARALNQQTHLGTLLDPLADKCLLVSAFGAMAFFHLPFFHVPYWFFLIIICREALMLLGALVLLLCKKGMDVQPLLWGKLTTALQIFFIMWIFVCYFAGWEPKKTHLIALVVLALFSLFSLCQYINRAMSSISAQ